MTAPTRSRFLTPFNVLVILGTISKFGSSLFVLALPLLFLKETGNPALALMALSVQAVPYLISPLLGEVVDRYDSRTVYSVAQLMLGLGTLLIPFFVHQPALIFVLLIFSGMGSVLAGLLNYYKLIPQLVPEAELERAIGTYMSVTDTAKLVAPLVGGLLITALGAKVAIFIDALTFFLMAGGFF
ncbi:MFS transporter [Deinococcus lacus]|uniref:MFS transporter n=1 Tax=Deinococcus lacus TaxID=392561 RepID=A0ABW1YB67_9DEIO